MANTQVDLSYKNGARNAFYDIEVLRDIFTNLIMTEGYVDLHLVASEHYDHIDNTRIKAAMSNLLEDKDIRQALGGKVEFRLFRYRMSDSHKELGQLITKIIQCTTLWPESEEHKKSRFTNFYGWNSSRYDLPMLCAARSLISNEGVLRTHLLKKVSDNLISNDGPEWTVYNAMAEGLSPALNADTLKRDMNLASYRDGHIDIAKIMKNSDDGEEAKFPPGLKKEMARFGLDIVIDETVSGPSRQLTDEEFIELILYNANDVFGTMITSGNDIVKYGLLTRDIVREMYPYTSARAMPMDKIGKWTAPERDATAANLAGLVLVGPNRSRPQDDEAVSYMFPIANGEKVDLLEYMYENEEYMHPYLYTFFDHFRGRDTRTNHDNFVVKREQPITHNAMMNCPYYRDGKPVDAYIRVSTGGAHGSVMAGLSKMSEEDVLAWIKSDIGATDAEKPTIDLKNVIHIDWSSFYPVLASKLGLYKTSDGVDRYTGIIDYRIEIKNSLPHIKADWTEQDHALQEKQMGLKFVLNNATGAGNRHKKNALLPLDNKTLSMRLMGNLHIWCLAQRLTQVGAYVVSTNTDGIYIYGITVERAQEVIDEYVNVYGMGVDPEIVDRFINRDTSNRIEYQGTTRTAVNGRLRHGIEMNYTDAAIGRNVPYPLVTARAALDYMDEYGWLEKPYDRSRLDEIIQKLYEESNTPEAWYHIHVGSGKRALTLDGRRQGRINRVVLTTDGQTIGSESAVALKKSEMAALITSDDMFEELDKLGYELYEEIQPGDKLVAYEKFVENYGKDETLVHNRTLDMAYETGRPDLLRGKIGILRDGEVIPLLVWKPAALTGYTTDKGEILNTRQSLKEFDMTKLDLKAYADWAEALLDRWKVTADIPEIGLYSVDDTVVKKKSRTRQTKKSRARDLLSQIYDMAISSVQNDN